MSLRSHQYNLFERCWSRYKKNCFIKNYIKCFEFGNRREGGIYDIFFAKLLQNYLFHHKSQEVSLKMAISGGVTSGVVTKLFFFIANNRKIFNARGVVTLFVKKIWKTSVLLPLNNNWQRFKIDL